MRTALVSLVTIFGLALLFSGCDESDDNFFVNDPGGTASPSPIPPPPDDDLTRTEDPPGVVFEIMSVEGGSTPNGNFQPGDTISVTFSITMASGSPWNLADLTTGRILVSGPTFNYQRVIAEQSDLIQRSEQIEPGVYQYTFADPIPITYLPPLNDTALFGPGDGELQGQPLLDGTYTVGIYGNWGYSVAVDRFRDHGDDTMNFLVGGSASQANREVVTLDHCNACHGKLQFHGGFRQNLTICLMCHTAGAEDRNNPNVAGGTPGVSIDFRVMIHKIHNAAHLPSVLGVATNSNGSRNYSVTPQMYQMVGFGNNVIDFSEVESPVWPHASIPHLRDAGYGKLSAVARNLEDTIRTGMFDCSKCHEDPDGDGPIEAPSQGALAFSQPAKASCGSCHDDIDWNLPYVANFQTMPPQATNGNCLVCHPAEGTQLATREGHIHPLQNADSNPGVDLQLTAVAEAGDNNRDGTLDPGEKVAITFFARNDAGDEINPAALVSLNLAISGPTHNSNLLLSTSVNRTVLTGPQPFTTIVPQPVSLDWVGQSTPNLGDVFTTTLFPVRTEDSTTVSVRTGTAGGATTLRSPVTVLDNFADVVESSGFVRGDVIVIDDGLGNEEFFEVQHVDGNRLWFNPGQTMAAALSHSAGATVLTVTLTTLAEGTDYSLDPVTGQIMELTEFGDGNEVLVSYTSDFLLPTLYPRPFNSSPSVDETSGKWTAKSIVDGTYTVTLWGAQNVVVNAFGETNAYRAPSTSTHSDFLVGSATSIEPYDLISTGDNCNSCHSDLYFHGANRRGFAACIACHGTVGSEDRPQYVAPNAPPTIGVTIDFRTMLHKIHMGEELSKGDSYQVVGFGPVFPNNFSVHTYEHVVFPSMPRGPKDCVACHGEDNEAYLLPGQRNHPTEQMQRAKAWDTCLSCHDSEVAQAHAESQTSPSGVQSCELCHGIGKTESVDIVHKIRDD